MAWMDQATIIEDAQIFNKVKTFHYSQTSTYLQHRAGTAGNTGLLHLGILDYALVGSFLIPYNPHRFIRILGMTGKSSPGSGPSSGPCSSIGLQDTLCSGLTSACELRTGSSSLHHHLTCVQCHLPELYFRVELPIIVHIQSIHGECDHWGSKFATNAGQSRPWTPTTITNKHAAHDSDILPESLGGCSATGPLRWSVGHPAPRYFYCPCGLGRPTERRRPVCRDFRSPDLPAAALHLQYVTLLVKPGPGSELVRIAMAFDLIVLLLSTFGLVFAPGRTRSGLYTLLVQDGLVFFIGMCRSLSIPIRTLM